MQNNTFFEDSGSKNIIVLEEVSSTNDYLKYLLTKSTPLEPFTAIMAKNQTAGKGQRGNVWVSEPNQNLTVSILLSPHQWTVQQQFWLTVITSLAVVDALQSVFPADYHIKWPNDIILHGKKLGGILIENVLAGKYIKHSIIGIGINVFQKNFPDTIHHKVTSLMLENPNLKVDFVDFIVKIQGGLKRYLQRLESSRNEMLELYNRRLFLRDTEADFLYEGKRMKGVIRRVEEDGLLQILLEGQLKKVDLKGIVYIL